MHYIHVPKTEPTEGIIITKNTKVMKTSDVDVPTEIQRQGALIANPTCWNVDLDHKTGQKVPD